MLRKFVVAVVVASATSVSALAGSLTAIPPAEPRAAELSLDVRNLLGLPAPLPQSSPDQVDRQGCCSWHGGVCGCSLGNIVCCDGQYSPSCGC
jgi:hypothetical protein